ncbi:BMP family protein [Paracoccus zhejiangensis]|uniref:BMP family ABC transporter substrate-binding protein n=1 Tax=Paracoccus zhejiangensis TaxID=1077935 RepID=A0A2H5EVC8_9RHOB|nr:BMP family protein [Paracoccus zhejiangensis]AUH63233.1 BMP family ABC transporter substrate-binding protein [Paracoccus zhejiangensis]
MRKFCFAGAMALIASSAQAQDQNLEVAMLLPGNIEDNGFMEAGYSGLLAIQEQFGAEISYIDGVKPEPALLEAALRKLADRQPDMVIAHGGQNNTAAEVVAAEYPGIEFVVVQGGVTGPNLSSYEVLQEESAWLAGAAAGMLTKSGVVGHISGIRVPPGLKGRGAFHDGLIHSNPQAKFVTIFAGDQDDNALSARVAKAEIEQGADIIFTMLNAGRTGATDAMREAGVQQIGNVIDWTEIDPAVFVASAVANVSIPSVEAVRDFTGSDWKPGVIKSIGLENPDAVSLTLSGNVPDDVRQSIDVFRQKIVDGEIEVVTDYEGPELEI